MPEALRIVAGLGCAGCALFIIHKKIDAIRLGEIGSRLFSLGVIAAIYYGVIKIDFFNDLFSQVVSLGFGALEPDIFLRIALLIVPTVGLVYGCVMTFNNRSRIGSEIKSLIYDDLWFIVAAALAIFASILL